jgi:hypothetical protein
MKLLHFIALTVLLSLIESGLVLAGLLPPVLSYSPGNLLFSLASLAVIFCLGWTLAKLKWKQIALKSGLAMLAGVIVICLAALLGNYINKPVLGIQVQSFSMLLLVLAFIIIENVLLAVILALVAAFIARKITKK